LNETKQQLICVMIFHFFTEKTLNLYDTKKCGGKMMMFMR
jgi:hypothetical protein